MTSSISTHVLDAVSGEPAVGVHIELSSAAGDISEIAVTNSDGRVPGFAAELAPGTYRLTFATGDYFAARQQPTLYPTVSIEFVVNAERQHYHIPLLLSPFAYSTYQGS